MPESPTASRFVDEIPFPVEVRSLLEARGSERVSLGGVEVPLGEVLKRLPCERYASRDAFLTDVRLVTPAVVGDRSPGPGQLE